MPQLFRIAACLLLATFAGSTPCRANNNLFLPGDAFFPTLLTKTDIQTLQGAKTGQRTFVYSPLGGYEEAFCGYAGYQQATIPAVDDSFARNLAKVYDQVRALEAGKPVDQPAAGRPAFGKPDGLQVLFYPPAFEFSPHKLGLRYNENWVAETLKFGHLRKHIRLCCLIPTAEATERSWRDADVVPALPAKLPQVKLSPVPATETPVVIQGPVKAFVLGSHSLTRLYSLADDEAATLFLIDSNGITRLTHHDGEWKSAEED